MNILAFNCYVFNSAACLVQDGRLVAAAQEERFTRVKHDGSFPANSIRFCLEQAGLTIDDVDHVGFHWRPFHQFHRRLGLILRGLPDSLAYWGSHGARWSNMVTVQRDLARHFPCRGGHPTYSFHRVRHHECHAASAFYLSPFEEAALLTVDGSGEMASTTLGVGRDRSLRLTREIHYPHSLGYLYVALTHYLGFQPDSDEYKVMALASLGEPRFEADFRDLVHLLPDGGYALDLSYFNFPRGLRDPWVSPRFLERFGPARRKGEPLEQRQMDLARALQKRLEDAVLHVARHLQTSTGLKKLCYAGGTALNSVLNTRLLREAGFDDVFVQPAANDAGTPLGSAYSIHHALLGQPRGLPLEHVYLGPAFSLDACRGALGAAGLTWEELPEPELLPRVARLLADGNVVGWFQGRMEMGPRALGNRSILADPRRAEMKDLLNAKVKHREAFRPFAPSVLEEHAAEYFDCDRPSPYMLFVYDILPQQRAVIPAVAHVDQTARVQTVSHATNPRYWGLIRAFGDLTGVPVVLNTSFNVMGEPIVCTPREAVHCFLANDIDILVLGDCLVRRRSSNP
jgi:carbamoyltransferase